MEITLKVTLVTLVIVAVLFEETQQQCFPAYGNNQPSRTGHADLYSGQQEFSLALLNAINKVMPGENLFFSPYSTYHALLIAYFLSGGQTESYLKRALKLGENQNKHDIYAAYKTDKYLTQMLARFAEYEFTNANKIYVSDQIPVRECIENDFPEELEKKAFKSNPEAARLSINDWVENTTHNMIKDLLPPGTVDQTTDLVLVNAAYFKGLWENKFNPELTKQEVFYVSPSKQIIVDMMHVEGTFRHDVSETLGAHILELPYKGDNISMYIILPPFHKTEDSIDKTLKQLTLENFKDIVESDNLISRTVKVALPKFSLETTVDLTPILESLGVGNLFKSDADFSSLTTNKISVGEGIHKAKIEINEHGAHAAAATALIAWRMSSDDAETVLEYMGVGDLFQSTSNFTFLSDVDVSLGGSIHKAKIEVNEEGTKAAAATVLFSFRSSRPSEPAMFTCDHPFIYVIYEKVQRAIMFSGVFRRPH